jgi:hypothetical protein
MAKPKAKSIKNFLVSYEVYLNGEKVGKFKRVISTGAANLAANQVQWHARHLGFDVKILGEPAETADSPERLKPFRLVKKAEKVEKPKTATAKSKKTKKVLPAEEEAAA